MFSESAKTKMNSVNHSVRVKDIACLDAAFALVVLDVDKVLIDDVFLGLSVIRHSKKLI